MTNKSIAVLTVAALIAIELSGMVWYRNYSPMPQNHVMTMSQNTDTVDDNLLTEMYSKLNIPMKARSNTALEPGNKERTGKDFTLVLDEWMSDPSGMDETEGMDDSSSNSHTDMDMNGMNMDDNMDMDMSDMDMSGMDMSDSGTSGMTEEEKMAYMYDIYTVNGKSGDSIKPLEVSKGDVVRLRFINAGYHAHGIHIPGTGIKIVSTGGQDINVEVIIKDQVIMIAPGERYEVEFIVASDDNFVIDAHDDNAYNDQLRIPVNVKGGSGNTLEEDAAAEFPVFNPAP